MPYIPPIGPANPLRKRRLLALERRIRCTHNRLPDIVKAMRNMPVRILDLDRRGHVVAGGEVVIRVHDHVQAVQLVRHGGGVDGLVVVLLLDHGGREVGVVLRVGDVEEAEALGDEGEPEGFGVLFEGGAGEVGDGEGFGLEGHEGLGEGGRDAVEVAGELVGWVGG